MKVVYKNVSGVIFTKEKLMNDLLNYGHSIEEAEKCIKHWVNFGLLKVEEEA